MGTVFEAVQQMAERNRKVFNLPARKIIVTKAGELFRARYEGHKTAVFVYEPEHASKKLKFFDGE